MADIFISYAREDAVRAQALAGAFRNVEWSVWWDDAIRAAAPFDAVIDQQLDTALCVVVLWSTASVASNWVRAEASEADTQGRLVPITFESGLRLPVRFRQLRVLRLTSTDILEPTEAAQQLLADITALTGKRPHGVSPQAVDARMRQRTSAARMVTAGRWVLTTRFFAARATYDLMLHANGTVTGTGRWTISRVTDLAGRWLYDPATQVLHLDMSGGIQQGTEAWRITVVQWLSPDAADCTFKGRAARLERVAAGPR